MKRRYTFNRLSRSEREVHEMVLLEEMEIQQWFAVAFCGVLGGEVFLMIQ